jgi:hypothetical protein
VDLERMEANLDSALGPERPDLSEIGRLIDSAVAAFEETRLSREKSVG